MATDKYHELDKAVSAEILASLEGQTTPLVCDECHGKKHFMDGEIEIPCVNCKGTGTVDRYYPPKESVQDAEPWEEPWTVEEVDADLEARNNVDLPYVDH